MLHCYIQLDNSSQLSNSRVQTALSVTPASWGDESEEIDNSEKSHMDVFTDAVKAPTDIMTG
jgi:hypothetical protein